MAKTQKTTLTKTKRETECDDGLLYTRILDTYKLLPTKKEMTESTFYNLLETEEHLMH